MQVTHKQQSTIWPRGALTEHKLLFKTVEDDEAKVKLSHEKPAFRFLKILMKRKMILFF